MAQIVVTLPDRLAQTFGATPEVRSRRLVEDAAIEEYRRGNLSHRDVAEMLGFDYWQTEEFFARRDVPMNYSATDLQADEKALESFLNKK